MTFNCLTSVLQFGGSLQRGAFHLGGNILKLVVHTSYRLLEKVHLRRIRMQSMNLSFQIQSYYCSTETLPDFREKNASQSLQA